MFLPVNLHQRFSVLVQMRYVDLVRYNQVFILKKWIKWVKRLFEDSDFLYDIMDITFSNWTNNACKMNVQLKLKEDYLSSIFQLRVFRLIGYSKMHKNHHERMLCVCVVGEKKKRNWINNRYTKMRVYGKLGLFK